ncbi:MAG: hypothetical protein P1U87_13380 [Verrucomicrobiales bacterium]|nr:hypothetical protein [Verrucomicrobiales bacterium]
MNDAGVLGPLAGFGSVFGVNLPGFLEQGSDFFRSIRDRCGARSLTGTVSLMHMGFLIHESHNRLEMIT